MWVNVVVAVLGIKYKLAYTWKRINGTIYCSTMTVPGSEELWSDYQLLHQELLLDIHFRVIMQQL